MKEAKLQADLKALKKKNENKAVLQFAKKVKVPKKRKQSADANKPVKKRKQQKEGLFRFGFKKVKKDAEK